MMQLYCPACENVVWLDGEAEDAAPCPSCEQPIHWLGRRKARPTANPDARLVAAPRSTARLPVAPPLEDEPPEQDFALPVPETVPVFVGLPYRAEGGVSLLRLPFFIGGVWLAAVALGLLASFLGQVCYLIFVYPLALGMALAGVTVLGGHLCRVRTPLLAGTVAVLGSLLALVAMHGLDYWRVLQIAEKEPFLLPETLAAQLEMNPSFLSYLDATARVGLTISGRETGGMNLGYRGTCAYWVVELVLVLTIAGLGGATGARDPACWTCGLWKVDRFLGTLHDTPEMRQQVQSGRLSGLACYRPAEVAGAELVLTVSACPRCGSTAPIDVRLERNPRARREPNPEGLPLRRTLPGEALPHLELLFHS